MDFSCIKVLVMDISNASKAFLLDRTEVRGYKTYFCFHCNFCSRLDSYSVATEMSLVAMSCTSLH